jgi:hypothetical protein
MVLAQTIDDIGIERVAFDVTPDLQRAASGIDIGLPIRAA